MQTDTHIEVVSLDHYYARSRHTENKQLSYRRETALQGRLVMTRSGRLELGDNILGA